MRIALLIIATLLALRCVLPSSTPRFAPIADGAAWSERGSCPDVVHPDDGADLPRTWRI